MHNVGPKELNKYNITSIYAGAIDFIDIPARIDSYIGGQCSVTWLHVNCDAHLEFCKHTLMSQPSGGASQHSRGTFGKIALR